MTLSTTSTASIHALAAKALAGLEAIETMLALDIVIRPNDKNQIYALNRVSDAAIGLASDIVTATRCRPSRRAPPSSRSTSRTAGGAAARGAHREGEGAAREGGGRGAGGDARRRPARHLIALRCTTYQSPRHEMNETMLNVFSSPSTE